MTEAGSVEKMWLRIILLLSLNYAYSHAVLYLIRRVVKLNALTWINPSSRLIWLKIAMLLTHLPQRRTLNISGNTFQAICPSRVLVMHVQIGRWSCCDGQQKQPLKMEEIKLHNGPLGVQIKTQDEAVVMCTNSAGSFLFPKAFPA